MGYVPTEIAEMLKLPEEYLKSHVQGYCRTVSHNTAVYTKYLGWCDGNPQTSTLPVETGQVC